MQQNALVWEYYRQAKEVVPEEIEGVLDALYEGEGFKIVESRYYEHFDRNMHRIFATYFHLFPLPPCQYRADHGQRLGKSVVHSQRGGAETFTFNSFFQIESDHTKGVLYFEGCTKFTDSLSRVQDMITDRIK